MQQTNPPSVHNSTLSEVDSNRTTLPPPTPNHQEPANVTQETNASLRRNRWRARLEELRNAQSHGSNNYDPNTIVQETLNNSIRNSFVEPSPSVHESSINGPPQNFVYEASNSSLINQRERLDELNYRQREIEIRAQEALIDMRQSQARYYDLAGESSRLYNQNLRIRNRAMALGSINQ